MYNIFLKLKKYSKYWRPELVYLTLANHDKNIRDLLKEQVATKYLKTYVKRYFTTHAVETSINADKAVIPSICWIYWRQGVDKAPIIIRRCVDSTTTLFKKNGWEVNVLDLTTAKKICKLPDYIWEKYNKGIISEAHLSDLIRLQLLRIYGGCWIDATVLFTEETKVPQFIYDCDLFVFRNIMTKDEYINISNWLISSIPQHPILDAVIDILLDYWKHENIAIQYYLFHIIFKMVTDYYQFYWKTLPFLSNIPCHILQTELYNPFSEKKWSVLLEQSSLHKLHWKIPRDIAKDSFYAHIIK